MEELKEYIKELEHSIDVYGQETISADEFLEALIVIKDTIINRT